MPARPIVKDRRVWEIQLLEHRRALLERLVAEFPQILTENRSALETWRIRLSGPKTGGK